MTSNKTCSAPTKKTDSDRAQVPVEIERADRVVVFPLFGTSIHDVALAVLVAQVLRQDFAARKFVQLR